MAMAINLSDYVKRLDVGARERYLEKISIVAEDPYLVKDFPKEFPDLPPVDYTDVAYYLIYTTSYLTGKQLKARKSLDSYNNFLNGWVLETVCKRYKEKEIFLLMGKVRHSQRSHMKPGRPWVLIESDGSISSSHCICMSGKGEVCSHVASILFYVEAAAKLQREKSCTEELSRWVLPKPVKDTPYLPLSKINFSNSTTQRNESEEIQPPKLANMKPTEEQKAQFLHRLSLSESRPAILALNPKYSSKYEPISVKARNLLIGDLYKPSYLGLDEKNLDAKCDKVKLETTTEILKELELATLKQSKCNLWFEVRTGRITASKLKNVCSTNPITPSMSLLKQICYPIQNKFTTPATEWGLKNESKALKLYEEYMKSIHINFKLSKSGICLNKKWLFMGASPDGKVACDCCGSGVVEVKCPYTLKSATIEEKCSDSTFCLNGHGEHKSLKKSHQYYYQVQAQINITESKYCDFLVYSPNEVFLERILPDDIFWKATVAKAEDFFKRCVLPEILGRRFTKK